MSDDIRFEAGSYVVIGIDPASINGAFSRAWSIAVSRSSYVLWDGEVTEPPPRPDVPIATEKPKSGRAWYHVIDSRKREYRHLRERRK